jgi:hypothetical protein
MQELLLLEMHHRSSADSSFATRLLSAIWQKQKSKLQELLALMPSGELSA